MTEPTDPDAFRDYIGEVFADVDRRQRREDAAKAMAGCFLAVALVLVLVILAGLALLVLRAALA